MNYVYKKPLVRAAMGAYDLFGSLFLRKRPPSPKGPPAHICFVVLHQIGDVVMCLPTIRAIMALAPGARFSALVGKAPLPIFKLGVGDAVEVHEFDAAWQYAVQTGDSPATAKESFMKLMGGVRPDCVIVFHPDLTINQLLRRTDVPYTIGFANAGGGFGLSHPLEVPADGHQVERNFALAEQFATVFGLPKPTLVAPALEPDQMPEALRPPGAYAVIHPFGRFNSRNWALDRWSEIVDALVEKGLTPVIIGAASDDAAPFLAMSENVIDLTGNLDLKQTAALMKTAALFIGIDSGPGHIASAAGSPVISIFSSANVPDRWSPYPGRVKVLYSPAIDRAKWPLEARDLPAGTQGNPYTDQIAARHVIEAIEEMLG